MAENLLGQLRQYLARPSLDQREFDEVARLLVAVQKTDPVQARTYFDRFVTQHPDFVATHPEFFVWDRRSALIRAVRRFGSSALVTRATSLVTLPRPSRDQPVLNKLQSRNADDRIEALTTLLLRPELKTSGLDEPFIDPLITLVEKPGTRRPVARSDIRNYSLALLSFSQERGTRTLVRIVPYVTHRSKTTRMLAAHALNRIAPYATPENVRTVMTYAREQAHTNHGKVAIGLIARTGETASVVFDDLVAIANDPSSPLWDATMKSLAYLGPHLDKDTRERLEPGLKNPDFRVKYHTFKTLAVPYMEEKKSYPAASDTLIETALDLVHIQEREKYLTGFPLVDFDSTVFVFLGTVEPDQLRRIGSTKLPPVLDVAQRVTKQPVNPQLKEATVKLLVENGREDFVLERIANALQWTLNPKGSEDGRYARDHANRLFRIKYDQREKLLKMTQHVSQLDAPEGLTPDGFMALARRLSYRNFPSIHTVQLTFLDQSTVQDNIQTTRDRVGQFGEPEIDNWGTASYREGQAFIDLVAPLGFVPSSKPEDFTLHSPFFKLGIKDFQITRADGVLFIVAIEDPCTFGELQKNLKQSTLSPEPLRGIRIIVQDEYQKTLFEARVSDTGELERIEPIEATEPAGSEAPESQLPLTVQGKIVDTEDDSGDGEPNASLTASTIMGLGGVDATMISGLKVFGGTSPTFVSGHTLPTFQENTARIVAGGFSLVDENTQRKIRPEPENNAMSDQTKRAILSAAYRFVEDQNLDIPMESIEQRLASSDMDNYINDVLSAISNRTLKNHLLALQHQMSHEQFLALLLTYEETLFCDEGSFWVHREYANKTQGTTQSIALAPRGQVTQLAQYTSFSGAGYTAGIGPINIARTAPVR